MSVDVVVQQVSRRETFQYERAYEPEGIVCVAIPETVDREPDIGRRSSMRSWWAVRGF